MGTPAQFFDHNGELRMDGSLVGGGGGSQPVLSTTVTLSSADILALDTTPKTLVAGVPGKVIVPLVLVGQITPGGTPYDDNPTERLFNGATFGSSGFGAPLATVILALTSTTPKQATTLTPYSDAGEALSANAGTPLRLDIVSAVTGGDGTAKVTVLYALVDAT